MYGQVRSFDLTKILEKKKHFDVNWVKDREREKMRGEERKDKRGSQPVEIPRKFSFNNFKSYLKT
jgi:hypothetical protein